MKRVIYGMLIFVPVAIVLELIQASDVAIFAVSGLAVIPLAKLIGDATEDVALRVGPKVGGLLNATLGNAAELIITILAISKGLTGLVIASITGSILGNLLLVMGLSLLLGGLKNGIQKFDKRQAAVNATMLIIAVVALIIPTVFDGAMTNNLPREQLLSESVAVVMIIIYALNVIFTFQSGEGGQGHGEHEEPQMSTTQAIVMLVVATLGVVLMSEFLVGAVEHVTEELRLTEFFIGIIIVPLIGNVAEHLVAVQVAIKDEVELSLSIAIGSSLQIALFVAPVLVFVALLFSESLLLVFSIYELIALFSASLVASLIALDGESNWLEGAMLLAVYLIVGIAFFFLPA